MKLARVVTLYLGVALAILGIMMELSHTTFAGRFQARRVGWVSSIMDGKTVIFFGLIFILLRQLLLSKRD